MGYNLRRRTPLRRSAFIPGNKYGAIRTNGFGSKLEAAVHLILKAREQAGEIKDIRQQDSVDLGFKIRWKVDFSFTDRKTGRRVWAEAKGVRTERYLMCLKLWAGGQGPGPLEIYEGRYSAPRLVKTIVPNTKEEKPR